MKELMISIILGEILQPVYHLSSYTCAICPFSSLCFIKIMRSKILWKNPDELFGQTSIYLSYLAARKLRAWAHHSFLMGLWSKSLQLHLTICDSMDCDPPVSSVHRILQARILDWVAISYSRGSSQARDRTGISLLNFLHWEVSSG